MTLAAVCIVDAVAKRLQVSETARGNPDVLCRLMVQTNGIDSTAFQTCTNRSSPTTIYCRTQHNTRLHYSAVQSHGRQTGGADIYLSTDCATLPCQIRPAMYLFLLATFIIIITTTTTTIIIIWFCPFC